jgi:hypothetical protein
VKLLIPQHLWLQLRSLLRDDGIESAAIAFANRAEYAGDARLLVSDILEPSPDDYEKRGIVEAQLSPTFVANAVRNARDRKCSVVFIHTHPFAVTPQFSCVDDDGERVLRAFLDRRLPSLRHAAMVIARDGISARELGAPDPIDVVVIGPCIQHFGSSRLADGVRAGQIDRFERQVRALGAGVQSRIAQLRVAVIGLGGTGSIATEQLTHLGVSRFVLVDPDVVDATNLNRVVGASEGDVGRLKVDVAHDMIQRINDAVVVECVTDSVLRSSVLSRLTNVDVVFCCTDSHGSRYVINELAYRYLVPSFDCGVVIAMDGSRVTHISSRIQMLAPGLACLTCNGTLDPEQVRRDLLTDFERSRDPYILGGQLPQPAVVSLNGTTVSLAVTMFLGAMGGLPADARHQIYNALRGTVRNVDTAPVANCVTCSANGALSVGDSWAIPGRPE